MKIKSRMQIVAIGLSFGGFALLISAGCASYQSYSGPALPRNQIAILKLERSLDSLRVSCVDGAAADLYPGASIQLLPGKHTVSFYPLIEYGHFSGADATYTITVKAGKTYVAWAEVTHLETWHRAVVPLEDRLKNHDVKWKIVIKER
jgi:hypothetical protein